MKSEFITTASKEDEMENLDMQLLFAVKQGNLKRVKQLVEIEGANTESKTPIHQMTPLHVAVRYEHEDILIYLLERGANVNTYDSEGWTPLHWSVNNCPFTIFKLLINSGSHLNVISLYTTTTPLHLACYYGFRDKIEYLLERGASPFLLNGKGKTVHEIAKEENYPEEIVKLIEKYIDIPNIKEPETI